MGWPVAGMDTGRRPATADTAPGDGMASGGVTLPTPGDYAGIHTVHSICRACDRVVPLDLPDLVRRGFGNVPLVRLPLRCAGCGSRDYGVIVSGRSYPGGMPIE